MVRWIKTILVLILFSLVCSVGFGQSTPNWGSATAIQVNQGGASLLKWAVIPDDTINITSTLTRKNGQIAIKSGILYVRDTAQGKWVAVGGGADSGTFVTNTILHDSLNNMNLQRVTDNGNKTVTQSIFSEDTVTSHALTYSLVTDYFRVQNRGRVGNYPLELSSNATWHVGKDTMDPNVNLQFLQRNISWVGFTGSAVGDRSSGAGHFLANVHENNTANWEKNALSLPNLYGVFAMASTIHNATGEIYSAAGLVGIVGGELSAPFKQGSGVWAGGFPSETGVKRMAGYTARNIKDGTEGNVYFHASRNHPDTLPTGNWTFFVNGNITYPFYMKGEMRFGDSTDLGQYRLQVTGKSIATDISEYSSDLSASYTTRTHIDKGYADATYAPISSSANYIQNTTSEQLSSNFYIDGLGQVARCSVANAKDLTDPTGHFMDVRFDTLTLTTSAINSYRAGGTKMLSGTASSADFLSAGTLFNSGSGTGRGVQLNKVVLGGAYRNLEINSSGAGVTGANYYDLYTATSGGKSSIGNKLLIGSATDDGTNRELQVTGQTGVVAGTLTDGERAISVSATLPAGTVSSYNAGMDMQITSATSTQNEYAFNMDLLAGGTDAIFSAAGRFGNAKAGTGTAGATTFGSGANIGVVGQANPTTTGANMGVVGRALNGDINIGLTGFSITTKNNANNIGANIFAANAGTTPTIVGLNVKTGTPSLAAASTALNVDNGDQAIPIALFRDNGSTVLTIADGGAVTSTSNVSGTVFLDALTATSAGTLSPTVNTSYVFTGTTSTWTLPAVTSNTNQSIRVKNIGTGAITVNTAGGLNTLWTTSATNTMTVNVGDDIEFKGYANTFWLAR